MKITKEGKISVVSGAISFIMLIIFGGIIAIPFGIIAIIYGIESRKLNDKYGIYYGLALGTICTIVGIVTVIATLIYVNL